MEPNGNDPVADFLSREKDELAGLNEDLTSPVSEGPDAPDSDIYDSEVEVPAGRGFSAPVMSEDFSELDESTMVEGLPSPPPTASEVEKPISQPEIKKPNEKVVPEKILRWREEFAKRVEEKDKREAVKIKEMEAAAAKELIEFNRQRLEQLEKAKILNRKAEVEFLRERDEQAAPGKSWEQIVKLCDFQPRVGRHEKDISRLRTMLLQMKTQSKEGKA